MRAAGAAIARSPVSVHPERSRSSFDSASRYAQDERMNGEVEGRTRRERGGERVENARLESGRGKERVQDRDVRGQATSHVRIMSGAVVADVWLCIRYRYDERARASAAAWKQAKSRLVASSSEHHVDSAPRRSRAGRLAFVLGVRIATCWRMLPMIER